MRTVARHGGGRGAIAALLAVLVGGCVVSPQPSPPVHDPVLNGGLLGGTSDFTVLQEQVLLQGKPGAVQPAEGVVVVTNLDAADPPGIAEVNGDGSFQITLRGTTEHLLRIQAKHGERRSPPMDTKIVDLPFDPQATRRAHLPCLQVEAWVSLEGIADARDAVVRNDCAEEVSIAAPRLRRGGGPFSVSPSAPFVVPAGGSIAVTVRADGDGDELEDVLFLDITAPEAGRRALTLTLPD
ncbi:hypothetical protein WMF31_24635 [Sorangium sp. So ce1036]|uniref:hypothetical protein n=1 Tax=Sorangium sp. So ce1036 TaxID=3133328 RepID=UPI003EFD791B